jgi:hypothetical protein
MKESGEEPLSFFSGDHQGSLSDPGAPAVPLSIADEV